MLITPETKFLLVSFEVQVNIRTAAHLPAIGRQKSRILNLLQIIDSKYKESLINHLL